MNPALVNLSGDTSIDAVLARIAASLTRQGDDVADMWQRRAIPIRAAGGLAELGPEESPIVIYRDAAQPGELGDHLFDKVPLARIYWGPIQVIGGTLLDGPLALSVTCSHEYVEMTIDPYANDWSDTPDEEEEAHEACDRVEGDAYAIDGVSVSDFLGPRAFRDGPGPFDKMGLLKTPWEMRPAGYRIRRVGGPRGLVRNDFGEAMPAAVRLLKMTSARRRKRDRKDRRS